MTNEYIIPGTSSKEISVFIENDPNIISRELIHIIVTNERYNYRVHKTLLCEH
jgi:hypothetical protein